MLKIGVRLPRQFEDSGDYLADARAMESAGADSLWLDDDGYDPWLLLAGMATITGRIRLVAPVASAELRVSKDLEPRIATLSQLSRGRMALAVTGAAEGGAGVDAAIALARGAHCCVILETASDRRVGLADGVVGFSESLEPVATLGPGTRVAWWGDTFRTVASVRPLDDGTGHLAVDYANGTSSRYGSNGVVRVLHIAPLDVPWDGTA